MLAFTILCWALGLAWLGQALLIARGMRRLADLNQVATDSLVPVIASQSRDLTVIIPACNEEECIAATLRSLLHATGLRLQIIAVNDRSTDRTAEIMDRIAEEASRTASPHNIDVLHIHQLPDGWLGKPHAMHCAAERACAPWLLFTDADVTFAPEALERALRYALTVETDHLVLVPTLVSSRIGERAMLALMHALTQWMTRYWRVSQRHTKDFLGLGGFNLLRKDAYHAIGGFSHLRMEVIEDISLGWMVKRGGFASHVVTGPALVNIRWLNGALGIVGNIEKNGFSLFRYRIGLCVVASAALFLEGLLPPLAIVLGGWAWPAGLLTYAAIAWIYHANRRVNVISPLAAVLFSPCAVILSFAFARSMVLCLRQNGVTWRGTHYPMRELRAQAATWK